MSPRPNSAYSAANRKRDRIGNISKRKITNWKIIQSTLDNWNTYTHALHSDNYRLRSSIWRIMVGKREICFHKLFSIYHSLHPQTVMHFLNFSRSIFWRALTSVRYVLRVFLWKLSYVYFLECFTFTSNSVGDTVHQLYRKLRTPCSTSKWFCKSKLNVDMRTRLLQAYDRTDLQKFANTL